MFGKLFVSAKYKKIMCWFETVSILHAVETCTRNRQFRAGLIYGKIVQQLKG